MKKKNGILAFIGPSGVGKNTLINRLRKMPLFFQRNYFSISWTTRSPRPGEVDGKDYYFCTREEFQSATQRGEFLEWAEFNGNLYGTPLTPIDEALGRGDMVLIDLETVGAVQLKKIAEARGWPLLDMFISPPSMEVLERRLRGRGDVSEDEIRKRLETARIEMQKAHLFRYFIVNNELDLAENRVLTLYWQYFDVS